MALYDDLMSPQNLGLFGLAGGLLEAGGPSKFPVGFGQALNRGGMQGFGMARTAELDKQAKAFQDEKVKFMQAQSLMEQLKYMQSLQPKPQEPWKLRSGEKVIGPDGRVIAENAGPVTAPPTRKVTKGDKEVTQSYIKGEWVDEAEGLKFNPRPLVDVTVPVNTFEPASVAAQREYIKNVAGKHEQLSVAEATLQNIEKAKELIPQAKGFMGPGGESLLEAAKFLNNRLGTQINIEGVKGAEELRSRIFMQIMDNLKKMDAQPSQMQQQIMMEALGKLGTDPNALPAVLDAFAEVIEGKVGQYNKDVKAATARGVKFPFDPEIKLTPRKKKEKTYPTPPQGAINHLKMSPNTAAQFDELFGPGAAARVLGQ